MGSRKNKIQEKLFIQQTFPCEQIHIQSNNKSPKTASTDVVMCLQEFESR